MEYNKLLVFLQIEKNLSFWLCFLVNILSILIATPWFKSLKNITNSRELLTWYSRYSTRL